MRFKSKSKTINKISFEGKKLTNREKLTPIAVLLIVFISLVIFVIPIFSKIGDNLLKIKENDKKLTILKEKYNELDKIAQNEAAFLDKFKLIESYLPSQKPSMQTLFSLMNMARKNNVQFSSITVKPGEVKKEVTAEEALLKRDKTKSVKIDNYQKFEISFNLIGTKENVFNFINKLKDNAPLMKIVSFSISIADLKASNSLITTKLTLNVYYQNPIQNLPSIETALPKLTQEENDFLDNLEKNLTLIDYSFESIVDTDKVFGKENLFADY
ncbi:hypothetical protein GYA19_00110 [Candidatus Beckwithbacteria bacterium]|nr:hypothetical protein [Candidatus Beckwithbacteria bacterium]